MTRVYRDFVRELNALWETSRAIATYLPQARLLLRQGQLAPLELGSFVEPPNSRNRGPETFGILQRAESSFPTRGLIAAVSSFELHLGSIAKLVYLNTDPSTVISLEDASDARIKKLVSWVFDSADREELIDQILDDKIRSVLSDGIVEVLMKDRLKLGLGRHFQTGHDEVLDLYGEISARRNVIIHQGGRADRAYRARHDGVRVGQRLIVGESYLASALAVMRHLATCIDYHASMRITRVPPGGTLGRRFKHLHPPG